MGRFRSAPCWKANFGYGGAGLGETDVGLAVVAESAVLIGDNQGMAAESGAVVLQMLEPAEQPFVGQQPTQEVQVGFLELDGVRALGVHGPVGHFPAPGGCQGALPLSVAEQLADDFEDGLCLTHTPRCCLHTSSSCQRYNPVLAYPVISPMSPHRVVVALFVLAAASACSIAKSPGSEVPPLPRTESPNLTKVKPPRQPTISNHFISDDDLDKLPVRKQPAELHAALESLSEGSIEERVAKLREKVINDLVFVRGGSFMRGDFARLMGVEGVTRMTYNEDDKVVREITLSDFWISRYKTTYAEFDVFTDATGRKRTGMEYEGKYRNPFVPAGTYWQDAKDYCQWLGEITGHPFDLPTEAQWEYAARSRGQFFMIATDDGNITYGRNIPYAAEAERLSPTHRAPDAYPVGLFPSNPLGLYDMSHDGQEWVNDWYAEDAYKNAQKNDPRGPGSGTEKVIRSWSYGDSLKIGVNVWRRKGLPIPMRPSLSHESENGAMVPLSSFFAPSARCVVSRP